MCHNDDNDDDDDDIGVSDDDASWETASENEMDVLEGTEKVDLSTNYFRFDCNQSFIIVSFPPFMFVICKYSIFRKLIHRILVTAICKANIVLQF